MRSVTKIACCHPLTQLNTMTMWINSRWKAATSINCLLNIIMLHAGPLVHKILCQISNEKWSKHSNRAVRICTTMVGQKLLDHPKLGKPVNLMGYNQP